MVWVFRLSMTKTILAACGYTSGSGKKYVEKYTVNLTAGSMLKADYRPDDENKALLSIPVLMQEMLKQNL